MLSDFTLVKAAPFNGKPRKNEKIPIAAATFQLNQTLWLLDSMTLRSLCSHSVAVICYICE